MNNTQFKKWDSDEEDQLLKEFSENTPIMKIASNHGRSHNAIMIRLQEIAVRLSNQGFPNSEIFKQTGVTEDQIIERRKEKARQIQDNTINRLSESFKQKNISPSKDSHQTMFSTNYGDMIKKLVQAVEELRGSIERLTVKMTLQEHLVDLNEKERLKQEEFIRRLAPVET